MIDIIPFEKVCENTPLNPTILQKDQFLKCKKIIFEINVVTLLGIDCLAKIQDDTIGLEIIYEDLKKDFSVGGGGLELSLSWLIYLEWLRKYGEAQITTKGLKVRTDDFVSVAEATTYKRMVADAEGTAIKFFEKTKEFLYSKNDVYHCVKEVDNCGCNDSKLPTHSTLNLPNFTVI